MRSIKKACVNTDRDNNFLPKCFETAAGALIISNRNKTDTFAENANVSAFLSTTATGPKKFYYQRFVFSFISLRISAINESMLIEPRSSALQRTETVPSAASFSPTITI